MIYIISGFYRSGTSAMMESLINGGMIAEWSEKRNQMADIYSDEYYKPNPNGLYEIPLSEYTEKNFPLKYQDKLIKVMIWGLHTLSVNPAGYKIIIMRRDPEEIRQSYEAFFNKKCPDLSEYHEKIQLIKTILDNRKDVYNAIIVDYIDLINNPKEIFNNLKINSQWDFDVDKASTIINPAEYRFRKELLTIGI